MLTSNQLIATRNYLGWTQDDLAKRVGVSATTIRNWEKEPHTVISSTPDNMLNLYRVLFEAVIPLMWEQGGRTVPESITVTRGKVKRKR